MKTTTQYLALYETTQYVEGDERSRTHPGHGYPAHTTTSNTYEEFATEADMLAWVASEETKKYGPKLNYAIVKVARINLEVKTVIVSKP